MTLGRVQWKPDDSLEMVLSIQDSNLEKQHAKTVVAVDDRNARKRRRDSGYEKEEDEASFTGNTRRGARAGGEGLASDCTENLHSINIGLEHPCGPDCGAWNRNTKSGCDNQVTCGLVCEGECKWLPKGEKGLFANADLKKGAWVALFETCPLPAGTKRLSEGTFHMQVRRTSGEGLGLLRATSRLGKGVAMLANASCCPRHQNAVIAQDAKDDCWIKLIADVKKGDEILLHYGGQYFGPARQCMCCLCEGRCKGPSDKGKELERGGT